MSGRIYTAYNETENVEAVQVFGGRIFTHGITGTER